MMMIIILLFMIAVPSIEQNNKTDLHYILGKAINCMMPLTEYGLWSILLYAGIVALWDGFSLLPVRYIELFVAMSFSQVQAFVIIMVIGKSLGGYVTHTLANSILFNKKSFSEVLGTNSQSFVFKSITQLVCRRPYIYGLLIRMFFPSILINYYLALSPLPRQQFIFIQFLFATIISYPQALFDYYGFLDKKFKLINGQMKIVFASNLDIITKCLDHRVDIYRFVFLVCQLLCLLLLAVRILIESKRKQDQFEKMVKERLIAVNQAKGVRLVQTKSVVEITDTLTTADQTDCSDPDESGLKLTREQIKQCIKKLDRIAREKDQSFEKTIDQIFNVRIDENLSAETA